MDIAFETPCMITEVVGADADGRSVCGTHWDESCSLVRLPGHDVDAMRGVGSAPDYPVSTDGTADSVLLLRATTKARVNDLIEVSGLSLKIIGISASYDSVGKIACTVVEAMIAE
jgi:hypothetical protein